VAYRKEFGIPDAFYFTTQFVRAVFFQKHPEVQLVVRGIRLYSLGRASSGTTGSTWGRLVEMYVSGAIVVQ
jgi:hypothetical protein